MRTKFKLRLAYLLGALTLAIPPSALALGAGNSFAKSAPKSNPTTQAIAYRTIAPRFEILNRRPVNVLVGQAIGIRGRLLPAQAWRRVELQAWNGHGWTRLATAYTRRNGRFVLRYVASGLGAQQLRVRFADAYVQTNAPAAHVTVFQETVASWYNDGGSTACGFHATDGVANKTLPCGTKVKFRLGGRSVTAVVDDRGPFVAGRTWDLNQNAAAALGVAGVATVWSSS
jgi:rare lipoprotein A